MIDELLRFWPHAVGYGFALVVGQIVIGAIAERMYSDLGIPNRPRAWQSMVLGSVERVLFIASLQIGIPKFIALWLGLKTAGGWKHWNEEYWKYTGEDGKEIKVLGRNTFNIFLIAQALSIGFAGVGWKLIEWLSECMWSAAIAAVVSTVIGSVLLWLMVKFYSKNRRRQ